VAAQRLPTAPVPARVIAGRGDLDPAAAIGRQRQDHRVAPDPLDLPGSADPDPPGRPVDGHQLVADSNGALVQISTSRTQRP
jgi:hypothetical protein